MKKWAYALLAVLLITAVVLGVSLYQAKGDIAGLVREVGTLNSTIEGKDLEIADLTADAADKEEQIKVLSSDTAEKGAAIEALQSEAEESAAEIEALKADAAEKDAAIEALSADVTERDASLEALMAEAAEKDAKIEALITEVSDKSEQIEGLNADADQRSAMIEELLANADENVSQIADLSSRLEQAEASIPAAEDLSGIKEGRFNNTKRLIAFLEENEIWYDVKTSGSDDESDQVFFYDLTLESISGVEFYADCILYLSPNNDRISVVFFDLITFDESSKEQVKDVLADLNAYWLWEKFYVEEDNTVTATMDCPLTDSPEMVDIMFSAIWHSIDIVEGAYDDLLPYNVQ